MVSWVVSYVICLMNVELLINDAFDSKGLDITNKQAVNTKFDALKLEVVYHCAAYTAVDNAEDEGKKANWKVNEDGTRNVAEATKRVGVKMVYISADYIFDGINPDEYQVESNQPEE